MTPAVVMRPIRLPVSSVNHRAPSGPCVIDWGKLNADRPVKNSKIPDWADPVEHKTNSSPTLRNWVRQRLISIAIISDNNIS